MAYRNLSGTSQATWRYCPCVNSTAPSPTHRVLVVDDEPNIVDVISMAASPLGGDDYVTKPFSLEELVAPSASRPL
jgi:CheY-like chemotaxis protein